MRMMASYKIMSFFTYITHTTITNTITNMLTIIRCGWIGSCIMSGWWEHIYCISGAGWSSQVCTQFVCLCMLQHHPVKIQTLHLYGTLQSDLTMTMTIDMKFYDIWVFCKTLRWYINNDLQQLKVTETEKQTNFNKELPSPVCLEDMNRKLQAHHLCFQ